MKSEPVKVNLAPVDLERLEHIAQATGLNRNDSVRKALATQVFISSLFEKGSELLIKDKHGRLRTIVWPRDDVPNNIVALPTRGPTTR